MVIHPNLHSFWITAGLRILRLVFQLVVKVHKQTFSATNIFSEQKRFVLCFTGDSTFCLILIFGKFSHFWGLYSFYLFFMYYCNYVCIALHFLATSCKTTQIGFLAKLKIFWQFLVCRKLFVSAANGGSLRVYTVMQEVALVRIYWVWYSNMGYYGSVLGIGRCYMWYKWFYVV